MNIARKCNIKEIPYEKLTYPKQDILVVTDFSGDIYEFERKLSDLSKRINLKITKLNKKCIVLSNDILCNGDRIIAFSGIGRTKSRLVYGQREIENVNMSNQLSEQIGNFCMIHGDENQIICETDYFGTEKLYYFFENGVTLISNRVHIIISAMKQLGINRNPNMNKIYTYLSHSSMVRQNFCQPMSVKGLIALRSDSRIKIEFEKNKLNVEKTKLYYELSCELPFDEKEYNILVKQAAEEIKDNIRIVLEHPEFETYVVDVTGGLDSRVVYCAISNFPEYRDKFVAHTVKTSVLNDFYCALKLISKYRIPFEKMKFKNEVITYEDEQLRAISIGMGATAEHTKLSQMLPYYKTCILPGAYGDYLGKPLYMRGKYDLRIGSSSISDEEFSEMLTKLQMQYSLFDASIEMDKVLLKEILALPGRTNLEKWENHYLYYRNGLHFSTAHDFQPAAPEWCVLQNKAQLKLKHMIMPLDYGQKVQIDISYELNPELASVTYESELYNNFRKKLNDQYGKYPECDEYEEKYIKELEKEWKENRGRNIKQLNPNFKTPKNYFEMDTKLDILHELIIKLNIRESAGCAMYYYIKEEDITPTYLTFIDKLYSLYFELF